jgi:hypothetical protein
VFIGEMRDGEISIMGKKEFELNEVVDLGAQN